MRNKRIISLVLALVMMLSLLPTAVFAAPENTIVYDSTLEYVFNSGVYGETKVIYPVGDNSGYTKALSDVDSTKSDQWKSLAFWGNSSQIKKSPDGFYLNDKLANVVTETMVIIDLNITRAGTYTPSLTYKGMPSGIIADVYLSKKTEADASASYLNKNLRSYKDERVEYKARLAALTADEKLGTVDMCETAENAGRKTANLKEITIGENETGEYLLIIDAAGMNEEDFVGGLTNNAYAECEIYSFLLSEDVTDKMVELNYNTTFSSFNASLLPSFASGELFTDRDGVQYYADKRPTGGDVDIATKGWDSLPGLRTGTIINNLSGVATWKKTLYMNADKTIAASGSEFSAMDLTKTDPFAIDNNKRHDRITSWSMNKSNSYMEATFQYQYYANFNIDPAGTRGGAQRPFVAVRVNVPYAGEYVLSVLGTRKALAGAVPEVYFGKAPAERTTGEALDTLLPTLSKVGFYHNNTGTDATTQTIMDNTTYERIGSVTAPTAGEYLIIFNTNLDVWNQNPIHSGGTSVGTNGVQYFFLSGIKLTPSHKEELTSLTLSHDKLTLEIGETAFVSATAEYKPSGIKEVTDGIVYSSDNTDAATVTSSGTITAVAAGKATITATYEGKSATVEVTVPEPDLGNKGKMLTYVTGWNALQADRLPTTDDSSLYYSGTYTRSGSMIINPNLMNRYATASIDADGNPVEEYTLMDFDVTSPWDAAFQNTTGGLRIHKATDDLFGNFLYGTKTFTVNEDGSYNYTKDTPAYTGESGSYVALRLNVPNKGKYNLYVNSRGVDAGAVTAVHFVRDSEDILGNSSIYEITKSGESFVGYHDFSEKGTDEYKLLGTVEAEKRGEYLVIFICDENSRDMNTYTTTAVDAAKGTETHYQQINLRGVRLAALPGDPKNVSISLPDVGDESDPMARLTDTELEFSVTDEDGIPIEIKAGENAEVTYASSDTSVAKIDENGVVSALKNGETTLSVTVKYGDAEAVDGTYKLIVADAGRNLMEHLNPGFDTEDWVWTVAREDEAPASPKFMRAFLATEEDGNRALGVKFDGSVAAMGNPAGFFLKYDGHRVQAKPGRFYQLTFKFKADYEIPADASEMQLIFDMYAYNNPTGIKSEDIAYNGARSSDISKLVNFRELYDDWYEVTVPIAAPSEYDGDAVYLSPRLIFRPVADDLEKAGFDGTAYFDDFSIREVGYEGVNVEVAGDTTSGSGSVTVRAKPYSTLGTPISLGGEWMSADAAFASSDEYVVGSFKSVELESAGNSDGINYVKATATLNGLNGDATVSAALTINGIERTGYADVTASGFEKKLLYATATAGGEIEVGGEGQIIAIGYMSDGSVADMTNGIIAYKSLTPDIISVDEETGKVTAHRAGTGKVQVDMLLKTAGTQAIAEVVVTDTSEIVSAQFASESMTVGHLRDADIVITGKMASGYDADIDYSQVEWIIECDGDGCGEDGHEHVISIDGNKVFGNVFGGKATVTARVTLNSATAVTPDPIAVEVVKTDLRDYLIDFRETESNDIKLINLETDGWELNTEKSHNTARNGYINNTGYNATTNAAGRKAVISAYIPYEGVYQIVFTGQYNGYNALLSDILVDDVRIGDYCFHNGANATAEPKSLQAVYLTAGVHEFTFTPLEKGSRNYYQTLKILRFAAKDASFEVTGVTAENTEHSMYLGDVVNAEARLKAAEGFLYAALGEDDPVAEITYESADTGVARVDAMGNITATGSGSTVITVTAKPKNSEEVFTLDINVNVEGGSIESTKLLPERNVFYVGEKVTLGVEATVSGAALPSDKMTLAFATSDKTVAAIDGTTLTGKKAGSAVITATVTYYNEPPVTFTTEITVAEDALGSVELYANSFVMNPDGNGITLTPVGKTHLGNDADITGAAIEWEVTEGSEYATVDANGHVSPLGVGQATVRVTVTPDGGEPVYGEAMVSIRYGKTNRTYYTDEMVAAAQENVTKYKWAQSAKKTAVEKADKYVDQLDAIYELIHSEGIPRSNAVGYRNDPDKWHCRYCGKNLYTDYGHYPWITDVLTRPWKVQCPDCKRVFPSNDFGSFYKLGLDEHGNFDRIRALTNHRAMLIEKGLMTEDGASAPKTEYSDEWYSYYGYGVSGGYLCNDTYSELWKDASAETYNKDPRTGDTIDGRRWGVDDSLGYRTGRSATGGTNEEDMEVHTYISVVSHCGIWYNAVGSGTVGVVNNALNYLRDAYLYTGDEKYGRAGAVLIDRVADVYADYDLRPWLLRFSNSDGGAKRGQIIGSIWETYLQQDFVRAYDAFFPMYDDAETLALLTEKAKALNFTDKLVERGGKLTVTSETIRQNIEDRLLREVFEAVQDTSSSGNFGMHQSALAMAGVILDNHPETDEMFDWIFRYGESDSTSYSTGGGVNQRLVDNVFRDGQGNESAFGYNRLWVTQLTELANTLARYPEYDGMSLYDNPKYIGMIQSYPYVTLVRRGVPAIGDGGGPASYPVLPDEDAVMLDSFKVLRNAESETLRDIAVEIAQHMYFVKKGELSDLHYDIFTKNPESLADEVEAIIEEHGEWDYDKSSMLTGYGMGILRAGTLYESVGVGVVRDTQRDMWLYFGGSQSHNNADKLSLGIESYGIGMTTDLGYPEATGSDPNRAQWQGSTIAHNTVVVNEKSQFKSAYSHKPLHYDGKKTRVKVLDIDAAPAYTETDEYRRTLVMIDYDDEVSYGIDFFKILGGDDHLYSFHANTDVDPTVSDNIKDSLRQQVGGSYAGVNVPYGKDPGTIDGSNYGILDYPDGYTWLDDVKRADNPGVGEFWVEYDIDDFRKLSRNGSLDMRLRMTMVNDWAADEISLVNGYPPRTPANLAVMNHLEYMLVRRKGKDLNTLFTTVIEPYNKTRYIESIEDVSIEATGGATPAKTDLAKAVKVTLVDGRIDYVVYAQNNKVLYTVTDGDYSFSFCGTVGVWTVRENGDGGYNRVYSYVNDGTTLGEGELRVADADAAIGGTVTNYNGMENPDEALSFENWIEVETDIQVPAEGEEFDAFAESLADRMFVGEREELGNSAFVIKSVTRVDDRHIRLNLGNITLVDSFKDKTDESLGYVFDVWQGQRFEIPMSYEDNSAPEFKPVSDLTVSAGSSVKVTVSATTENDDGVINYSARTLPRGASFNADTATFNWKPDASQIGENLVAIDARDSDGRISTQYFVVTVYGSTTGSSSNSTNDSSTDNSGTSTDGAGTSSGGGGGGGGGGTSGGETTDTPPEGSADEDTGTSDKTDNENSSESTETAGGAPAGSFDDVTADAWYNDAATWMGSHGYMSGTAPGKFSPDIATTRGMLVTILYRISGSPEVAESHGFEDVASGSYYEKAIAWAAENGIVTGHSDTVFAPDELITREQLAAIIYRNEKRLGNDVSHSADLSRFVDGEHVSAWALEAKAWAVGAGIINGTSETTLHPTKTATRAECATILYRIFGNR